MEIVLSYINSFDLTQRHAHSGLNMTRDKYNPIHVGAKSCWVKITLDVSFKILTLTLFTFEDQKTQILGTSYASSRACPYTCCIESTSHEILKFQICKCIIMCNHLHALQQIYK